MGSNDEGVVHRPGPGRGAGQAAEPLPLEPLPEEVDDEPDDDVLPDPEVLDEEESLVVVEEEPELLDPASELVVLPRLSVR